MMCSFFKDKRSKKIYNVKVIDVLAGIKNGRWRKEITKMRVTGDASIKNIIPAATFSGVFKGSRHDDNIETYTGLVTIDIDVKKESFVRPLKKRLSDDPFIYSAFISPRGGLKALVKVDAGPEHHKFNSYQQVREWMDDNHHVAADKSGSNISRLCYVSFDEELYVNEDSEIFTIDTSIVYHKPSEVVPSAISWDGRETNIQTLFETCSAWVEKKGVVYGRGSRNQYIFELTCFLNEAGLSADQILFAVTSNHSISQNMYAEIKGTIEATCKRKGSRKGAITIKPKRNKTNMFDYE